jgi:aflatoxin B1 aldehyde reductase
MFQSNESFLLFSENLKVLLAEQYPDCNVSVPEAAYRWLYHHSRLSGEHGDCVIVGASGLDQLTTNLGYTHRPPLDKPVVQFFSDWWKSTKHMCPKYFR